MMFYFSKIIFALISPLGLTLVFMFGLSVYALKRQRIFGLAGLAVFLCLLVCSLNPAAYGLARILEKNFQPKPIQSYPNVEVIALLGGGLNTNVPEDDFPGLAKASDRVRMAARLYIQGKARVVAVLGGAPCNGISEAEGMRVLLEEWGVPGHAIIMEDKSRTTRENAINFKKLFPDSKTTVLLVTSAWHMARSKWVFEKAGFKVIPAPTDFEGTAKKILSWNEWLPSAQALETSSAMIHEFGGMLWYRLTAERSK